MARTFKVVIYQEGEQWVAQALNVEIASVGDTPAEARAAIQEALELYFEDEPEEVIPDIQSAYVEELTVS